VDKIFRTDRRTSSPIKSAGASGPIGWLQPSFSPWSISSALASLHRHFFSPIPVMTLIEIVRGFADQRCHARPWITHGLP
jgi:hypothetical protein